MARKHEAAQYIRDGDSPSAVVEAMGIGGASVRQYLLLQVAEGDLLRIDILRSIDGATKESYEAYITDSPLVDDQSLYRGGCREGFDEDDFRLYLDCREALAGELYTHLANLEIFLHENIRAILTSHYGPDELEWWKQGIPFKVRESCVTSREADPYPPGETVCIHHNDSLVEDHGEQLGTLQSDFASRAYCKAAIGKILHTPQRDSECGHAPS